MQILAVQVTTL